MNIMVREVMLHYPGLYAGATDLICSHNGMETVVDFKQSNRPKREEYIEDYYLQISAYAMAHDYVYGSQIKQGVIMICTPDLYYQEFKIEGIQLRKSKHEFLKRLDMYNELQGKKIKTPSEQSQDELEPITTITSPMSDE
jgi:hypothetical protein